MSILLFKTEMFKAASVTFIYIKKLRYLTKAESVRSNNHAKYNKSYPSYNVDDRNAWRWGFTPQAELWNGRLAAIGFLAAA